MKFKNSLLASGILLLGIFLLQSHSAGRAGGNDRDNTGAPGGQTGGNGRMISCANCHNGANFEVGLDLELIDADGNLVNQYIPNEIYTATVSLETLSGMPSAYGFQMVSLLDSDDSDVNGWVEGSLTPNAQLSLANSTGRVYAEQDGTSESNEFSVRWQAPAVSSGDVSFYLAGVGVNANGASAGDHAPTPIRIILPELNTSDIKDVHNDIHLNVYPNPTVDNIYLEGSIRNTTVEIYHSTGLVSLHDCAENKFELTMTTGQVVSTS